MKSGASEFVRAARALVGGELREDYAFVVREGTILYAGDYAVVREHAGDLSTRSFPADRLVVPGFVNGHSHAYQIILRGWADDWTFARWRSDALYKVVPQLTPDDIYWIFIVAFSEMLAAGITAVAEFFYLNGSGNAHAEAAIAAAQETGIRLVLARTWMDADYAPPQFRESIEQAQSRTLALMEAYPWANVCVAPHSLHAASHAMIRAAADFARSYDCLLHVHVAEAAYEGSETLQRHGTTPIALLDELGALDRRTVAIHAIHATQEEKRLLAERGARVIHNPMTNQYLGDGICDVSELQALGVTMGLGTDADVKPSLIDEMRSATLLQKILRSDGSALGARAAFDMGTAQGARALGLATGDLIAGTAADYLVLDASAIDPWSPPVQALVYRGEDAWVQAAFVNGARVFTGEASAPARHAREKLKEIAKRVLP
ncbi:MAG TPA: amidohydrolase family protein [Candidatus Acidoferrales bacterium]|nr:amidohydrolase family protein [Candidatus Acidoferrales bacterium]